MHIASTWSEQRRRVMSPYKDSVFPSELRYIRFLKRGQGLNFSPVILPLQDFSNDDMAGTPSSPPAENVRIQVHAEICVSSSSHLSISLSWSVTSNLLNIRFLRLKIQAQFSRNFLSRRFHLIHRMKVISLPTGSNPEVSSVRFH